jgi:hypothetical protein
MSPRNSNNNGGTLGRAAFGGTSRADAARADDVQAIVGCPAIIALAGCALAFNAPDIWPQAFGQRAA